ncbi:MAG: hypothetical protein CSA55_03240 [Ilumatobacter coccineus]|uniref:Uncharacterized protein n=1 Tax=Ilumatobacter coccineus TaxID=467094 RepID=A0A2G6KA13_9ACTN|nr:MAG: hypothetical protein CSA55_03240 [Ilumatobacter coccineus]
MRAHRPITRGLGTLVAATALVACSASDSTGTAPSATNTAAPTASATDSSATAATVATTTMTVDDPDQGWQETAQCQMTPILRGIYDAPSTVLTDELASSPLAPYLDAAVAGDPIPAIDEAAARWSTIGPPGQEVYAEALEVAIWLNCPSMVSQILNYGVPADGLVPERGQTPALIAASLDEWDIVLLLLDAGADPLAIPAYEPWWNLVSEAVYQHPEMVTRVLDYADPTRPEMTTVLNDALAITVAYANENPDRDQATMVEFFLERGAQPSLDVLVQASRSSCDPDLFATLVEVAGQQDDLVEMDNGSDNLCYLIDTVDGDIARMADNDYGYDPKRIQVVLDLATAANDGQPPCG